MKLANVGSIIAARFEVVGHANGKPTLQYSDRWLDVERQCQGEPRKGAMVQINGIDYEITRCGFTVLWGRKAGTE